MKIENLFLEKHADVRTIKYVLDSSDSYVADVEIKIALCNNLISLRLVKTAEGDLLTGDVSNYMTLRELSNFRLNKKAVLTILKGVLAGLELVQQGQIAVDILLDTRFIFIDTSTYDVKLVALPLAEREKKQINEQKFFRDLLAGLRYDLSEQDNYVANLLTLVNEDSFSNKKLQYAIENLEITSTMLGNLMNQLGTKPVPHLVRKSTGEVIQITKDCFVIGKSKVNADYVIENNSAISREHCVILQREGLNYIKDNHSTNHTFADGVELIPDKEVLLKNKMKIQLGDETFTFYLRKGE